MSRDLTCITNYIAATDPHDPPHIRGCTIRDTHLTSCTDPSCTGCFPRPATHGHVCQSCYNRIDRALRAADRLRTALNGIDRAIRPEGSNGIAGPRLPLTAIRLDLEAINRWQDDVYDNHHQLITAGYHGHLDTWVNQPDSAIRAVEYAREVNAAAKRHPIVATTTRMERVRCGRCYRITVIRRPPEWYEDDVVLHCTDPDCGWTSHDQLHAEAADVVEMLIKDPYTAAHARPEDRNRITDTDRARIAQLVHAIR